MNRVNDIQTHIAVEVVAEVRRESPRAAIMRIGVWGQVSCLAGFLRRVWGYTPVETTWS